MKRKKKAGPNYNIYGWIFISLAFLLYIIFTIYPAIDSLLLAFQSFEGGKYTFVGLKNFKRMFGDAIFLKSLGNTFLYMVIQVPIMLLFALIIATLLNSKFLKFKGFFRTSVFLPCVTSLVAYSIIFKMLFSLDGLLNQVLIKLGILDAPYQYLQDSTWARAVIIIAMIWRWTGYNVIFYLSAMQNIPKETFEAAKVDGANAVQTFFKITIPQLKPIVLLTTIMSTNGTLQLFDETMNITQGGPANATITVSHYIYNQSFVYAPTLIYTFISILICSMAGYGFEKYRSKGKNIVYSLFLFSMMIPFSAQMIPLFKMASKANMLNSHTAVILPTLAMPFLVFFFRQSFQSYPTELIEAARIDGANEFTIFFRLVMAPMKSTFAAGAIYAFMKQWNNYLWPLIVIQTNEKKTFTLLLSSLASAYYVDYGQLMLAIVLATIPIIIVFLTMQKQFVEGIVGSSK